MGYDAKQHSKDRLGSAGMIPALPMMPIAAQVSCATGMVHYRLMGDSYVRGGLPSVHPASYQAVIAAIKGCPVEPSYSGSPSPYYKIEVDEGDNGQYAILKAQGVVIGRVAVFASADIVSAEDIGDATQHSGADVQPDPPKPDAEPADPDPTV